MSALAPAPWRPAEATSADFAAVHALQAARDVEVFPGDVPTPRAVVEADLRHVADFCKAHHWVARDGDGRIVARSHVGWMDTAYNRHLADVDVQVLPEFRRRGLGRAMLGPPAVVAQRAGRDLLLANEVPDAGAAPGFLNAVGFVRGATERRSRLQVADADVAVLRDWANGVDGYELVAWDGPTPPHLLAAYAALKAAQSDAPWGDIEVEPESFEVDHVAQIDQNKAAAGCEAWTVAARPAGREDQLAGYTQLLWRAEQPHFAFQNWTVVAASHRRRGLARWIKAVNALRLLETRPSVSYIDTVNEVTNAPMLAVNIEMGFRPLVDLGSWTAPAATFAGMTTAR